MESGIKTLIEKEKEAREQVELALLYKEEMKRKSKEDAQVAVSMILEEQNQQLEKKFCETKKYLQKVLQEKQLEFNLVEASLKDKDLSKLVKRLAEIISDRDE